MSAGAGTERRLVIAFRIGASIATVAAAALPIYLLAKQALTPEAESFAWPPMWLPHQVTLSHFADVFAIGELRSAILRSIGVALASGVIATALGAMLAYAMARSAEGRSTGLASLTLVRLLPMIAVAIPLALGLIALGMYDTPSGLGLAVVHAALALPMTALMTYGSFLAIPVEVEEAAWLDGASPARIFLTIDLPLARGALA